MELHRFTMQVKSEIEARPSNNNSNGGIVVIHSSQDPSSPTATSGGYLKSFPVVSSTPKKQELESEV